jgi:hypothetical protein
MSKSPKYKCKPVFELGHVTWTPGVQAAFDVTGDKPFTYLLRHHAGDWGELTKDGKFLNDRAVLEGTRIVSAYELSNGTKIWIITEADRSLTTFLLPSEY